MTNPSIYLVRILLFIVTIIIIVGFLIQPIGKAFAASPALNGMIIFAFLLGIIFIIRKVALLRPEVAWITAYRIPKKQRLTTQRPPKLLAPIANMLGERQSANISLSTNSLRSLLDSVDSRLSESRDTSKYLIGLLIFLGLLGTFWGLLETIGAVSGVIGNLSIKNGNLESTFSDLKTGLEAPLSGMATSFSSSLFGLAGSLALGFLDLQLGQAQNRFYNDLEEWLSGLTKLSAGTSIIGDGETSASAYQAALFEQTAESLDRLQRVMVSNEDDRQETNNHLINISEKLVMIINELQKENLTIEKVSSNISKFSDLSSTKNDVDYQIHLRNIDTHTSQLVEEVRSGRAKSIDEIRQEIRLLARTIAVLAEESE